MVNEHTVFHHPSSLELTSMIHPIIFLRTAECFISPSLKNICWIFSQTCISHHCWKIFQIHGIQVTTKCLCESKNWIYSVLLMPPSKTLSHVLIIIPRRPRQREILNFFLLGRILWILNLSAGGWGERNYERDEKVTKIKLVRVLVTSFNKSHHLCTFDIFGYCFVVP